MKKPLPLNSVW